MTTPCPLKNNIASKKTFVCENNNSYFINEVADPSCYTYKPNSLKLNYSRLNKKYERVCDQYRILESENIRLKKEIDSYMNTKSTDFNEPESEEAEDNWWRKNEVYLQKAEIQAYVKLVKDLNIKIDNSKTEINNLNNKATQDQDKINSLEKQIKYLTFKNNLLEKKVSYRNGVFNMIEKCIDGDIQVEHPDYKEIDMEELAMLTDQTNPGYSKAKRELTLTELCMEKAKKRQAERKKEQEELQMCKEDVDIECHPSEKCSQNITLDINYENNDVEPMDIDESESESESDSDSSYEYSSTESEDEDETKEQNDVKIHSKIYDEKPNETTGKNVTNVQPNISLSNNQNCKFCEDSNVQKQSKQSFKSVFGKNDEHIFRNCCLKVLYGNIPSYGVWEQLEGFDVSYWDSFDEAQCYKIICSIWSNYAHNYYDLKHRITTVSENVPEQFKRENTMYSYVLKDLVSWLFM